MHRTGLADVTSLAESEADLARLALERAVVYGKVLEKLEVANPQEADISVPECNRLEAEYFVLRTALVSPAPWPSTPQSTYCH